MLFEDLPVELIAEVLGELDLPSLITVSYLSKRLHLVASDSSLNPWRRPILTDLRARNYTVTLKHLSVRSTVPRQNWVEILSLAPPSFLLFDATLPNLRDNEWEECFNRRFLPSWQRWRKDGSWKQAFLKVLFRLWHRGTTSCTSDEAWTKYIVLNRNGSANVLELSSRNFNPVTIFNELKLQNNLAHLETRIRLLVEFVDIRILAFGTMTKPRNPASFNTNAHLLLNPPGITPSEQNNSSAKQQAPVSRQNSIDDHGVYPISASSSSPIPQVHRLPVSSFTYSRLTQPIPALMHVNYPFYTPGGLDLRWSNYSDIEDGSRWVGSLMLVAQILGPSDGDALQPSRQYASFDWSDLWAIAPWLEEIITTRIDGPGLGH